jgi:hypothetical protein
LVDLSHNGGLMVRLAEVALVGLFIYLAAVYGLALICNLSARPFPSPPSSE